jgi:hypothetical protein
MKKIFTIISLFSLISTGGLLAQTPNASFETWTHNSFPSYDTPDSWSCANSQTALTGVYSCLKSTSVHSGSFAIQLITKNIGSPINQLVPGVATTGTLPSSNTGTITGGVAYTLRPDSITGWYKYTPQGTENGFVQFALFGSGGMTDTIAVASFSTPKTTVGVYTRFTAPLIYRSANAVVNSVWLLSSSNNDGLAASVGSTLFADDLNVVINPSTAGVTEHAIPEFYIGPNPAVGQVRITNAFNAKALFILYDITGNKVAEQEITNSTQIVSVNTLPAGLYIYSITDQNTKAVKTGKIIIRN